MKNPKKNNDLTKTIFYKLNILKKIEIGGLILNKIKNISPTFKLIKYIINSTNTF